MRKNRSLTILTGFTRRIHVRLSFIFLSYVLTYFILEANIILQKCLRKRHMRVAIQAIRIKVKQMEKV